MNRKPYCFRHNKNPATPHSDGGGEWEWGNRKVTPLFSSWARNFKTCHFLVNICLVLIDFLTKEVFSYRENWVPRAVYDCPLGWRRKYNRSCVRKFHVPGPMKFCQICQSTNFYFFHLSKVFMTVLHQNMTNDRAPPKFDKWPCSTEI